MRLAAVVVKTYQYSNRQCMLRIRWTHVGKASVLNAPEIKMSQCINPTLTTPIFSSLSSSDDSAPISKKLSRNLHSSDTSNQDNN